MYNVSLCERSAPRCSAGPLQQFAVKTLRVVMTSSASGQRSVSDCWADYRSDAEVSINYSVFVPVASRLSHFFCFFTGSKRGGGSVLLSTGSGQLFFYKQRISAAVIIIIW